MAGEIASAYISLLPKLDAKGLKSEAEKGGEEAGRSVGKKTGGALSGALKTALKVAPFAAMGLSIGAALTKGFARLTNIENATAKLTGLGHAADSVKSIMNDALASVKGTAFGLDEAATVAAGAVASGIKPGKQLEGTLRLIADAATIGGSSMGEMGAIFNKVAASGKLQGDVIAQLGDRGIPILQMLGKVIGKTPAEVSKLASQGKIDFETFSRAMQEGLGGAALKSGDTTQGAFKNMGAAVSRFGQTLLKGVFPLAKEVFGGITSLVDNAGKAVEPFATAVSEKIVAGFHALKTAGPAIDAATLGIRKSLTGMLGSVNPERIVLSWADLVKQGLYRVRNVVNAQLAGLTQTIAERIGVPLAVGDTWRDLAQVIGFRALDAVQKFGKQMWETFKPGLMETARTAADALGRSWEALKPYVQDVFGRLKDTWAQLVPILPQLLGALNPVGTLLKGLLPVLPVLAEAFGRIAQSLANALLPIIPPLAQAFTVLVNAGLNAAVAALVPLVQWAAELARVLAPLAPAVVAVWAGFKGVELVKGAVGGVTEKIAGFKDRIEGLKDGFGKVKEGFASFKSGLDTIRLKGMYAKDAISGMITKLGGMKSALMTLGIGAAAVGVVALGAAIAKWNDDAASMIIMGGKLKEVTKDWTSALVASNGALDDNVRLAVAKQIQDAGLADKAAKAGISLRQLTDAVTSGEGATWKLIDAWRQSGKPSDETVKVLADLAKGYGDASGKADQLRGAQGSQTTATQSATTAMQSQVTAADMLRNSLDLLSGKAINTEQAALSLKQGMFSLTDQVQRAAEAGEAGAQSLDDNTAAGLRNKQSLLGLIQQANAHAQAVAAQTDSVKAGTDTLEADKQAILNAAAAAGLNTEQVKAMTDALLKVPDIKPKVDLDISNFLGKITRIRDEMGNINSLQIGAVGKGIGANAAGTDDWRGGPTWVAERGREIISLPPHSSVINNGNTEKIIAALQGGSVDNSAVVAAIYALGDRLVENDMRVARLQRDFERAGRS